ncbi:MAG: hypothetical protein ACQETH_05425 [Candidatus Rifleibacteriota bacterium]
MKKLLVLVICIICFVFALKHYFDYKKKQQVDLPPSVENTFTVSDPDISESVLRVPHVEDNEKLKQDKAKQKTEKKALNNRLYKVFRQLIKDNGSWPLAKSPDYWIISGFIKKDLYDKAIMACVEALNKPQPDHFSLYFDWFHLQLKFYLWLKKPAQEIEKQVRSALNEKTSGYPSSFLDREFQLGLGFVASDTEHEIFPAKSDLLASMTAKLKFSANKPSLINRTIYTDLKRLEGYYNKLCKLANKKIPKKEFHKTYAAVDYVYQERMLINPDRQAAGGSSKSNLVNIEKYWHLPQIPVVAGFPVVFNRTYWLSPFGFGVQETEKIENGFLPKDSIFEAWSAYFMVESSDINRIIDRIKLMEFKIGN